MFEKLREQAMGLGTKLMSNPKLMKLVADPRLLGAVSRGFALKGRIQSDVEGRLRGIARALNLATKDEVESLRRTLSHMEDSVSDLARRFPR